MSELNLPVLDLSLLDQGPDAAASFREQLRAATHDVGFFYLTGTGVTPELEARLHRELVPHQREEERALYPEAARRLGINRKTLLAKLEGNGGAK